MNKFDLDNLLIYLCNMGGRSDAVFTQNLQKVENELKLITAADRAKINRSYIFTQLYRSEGATRRQRLEVAKLLLKYKIPVNSTEKTLPLPSALFYAIESGDAEAAEFLLKNKADPNEYIEMEPFNKEKQNTVDRVPLLTYSEACEGTETSRLLLKHGAAVNAKSSNGLSVIPYFFRARLSPGNYKRLKSRVKFLCNWGYDLKQQEGSGHSTTNDIILYHIAKGMTKTFAEYETRRRDWEKFTKQLSAGRAQAR